MEHVIAHSVSDAYIECLWRMRICGRAEESRNGPVLSIKDPFYLTITDPRKRLLGDQIRRANPYFHMAEFIWMMAGSNDARWLSYYNRRMLEYAENGVNEGAYGHRWREHFDIDQIPKVVKILKSDHYTRRGVLGMWDPEVDLKDGKDLPCNTHIYFRVVDGCLDMTVCNRSNDLIWGMLGANVVHMTMLHELISLAADIPQGKYKVFTNNLHIYRDLPDFRAIMDTLETDDIYRGYVWQLPLLQPEEDLYSFLCDAEDAVFGPKGIHTEFRTEWFKRVAQPMLRAYEMRKESVDESEQIKQIVSGDWQKAAKLWKEWKNV